MFVSSSVRIAFIIYRGEYKCILFMGDIDPCMHIDQSSFREDFLTVEGLLCAMFGHLRSFAVRLAFPFLGRRVHTVDCLNESNLSAKKGYLRRAI